MIIKYLVIIGAALLGSISSQSAEDKNMNETTKREVTITINKNIFKAELENNETANEFYNLLPLNINMDDLNDNEKYYYFNKNLPSNSKSLGRVYEGEILLYQGNCLVIFYEDYNTNYQYSKIGNIKNSSELKSALGPGSTNIKIEKN